MKQNSIENIRIKNEVTQAFSAIIIAVLVLVSVIMISMIVVHVATPYALDVGIGTSMEPAISTGDILIIDRSVEYQEIEEGDVIHKQTEAHGAVYHRAQAYMEQDMLYTAPDSEQTVDAVCVGPDPRCPAEYRGEVVYVIRTSELF